MKKITKAIVKKAMVAVFAVMGVMAACAELTREDLRDDNGNVVGYKVTGLGNDEVALVFTKAGEEIQWTVPADIENVQFLAVGGGGAGGGAATYGTTAQLIGSRGGAGGGGGGVVTGTITTITKSDKLLITIGKGGVGGKYVNSTTNKTGAVTEMAGDTTVFIGETRYIKAGAGGSDTGYNTFGGTGASSSGSRDYDGISNVDPNAFYVNNDFIKDVQTFGHKGGCGNHGTVTYSGGGGGGAGGVGAAGSNASPYAAGKGGAGLSSDITGNLVIYGAGGGGGSGYRGDGGKGGDGVANSGAGNGGSKPATTSYSSIKNNGSSALANQGGGGGGAGYRGDGGDGGSGVVVFRYVEKKIKKPVAISNLVYTGDELVGVPEGFGYYFENNSNKATEVGTYTAVAKLQEGKTWSDGTTDDCTIEWTISTRLPEKSLIAAEDGYIARGLGNSQKEIAFVFTKTSDEINWAPPATLENVQFLVVGGGGGGGADNVTNERSLGGAGGGGGGVVIGSVAFKAQDEIFVAVGAGGLGGAVKQNPAGETEALGASYPGEQSKFTINDQSDFYVVAYGGGRDNGATSDAKYSAGKVGGVGGSNGGNKSRISTAQEEPMKGQILGSRSNNAEAFGSKGGISSKSSEYASHGGGGARSAGDNYNGGEGLESNITGKSLVYGSGGGGGNAAGSGGIGGTGAGNGNLSRADVYGFDALPNQGGGGGGSGGGQGLTQGTKTGGNGGSGIVVFRFVYPEVASVDGYGYLDLGAAISAAEVGEIVTLLANAGNIELGKSIALNLNGCTVDQITLTDAAVTLTAPEDLEVKTSVDGYEVAYDDGVYSLQKVAVVQIGETTYATLAEAVAAAQSGDTIVLIENVELAETVTIPVGKTLIIDLNGKSISMEESIVTTAYALNNLGTLTLKDSVGTGSVNARGIYNGADNVATAKIIIQSGTYNAKGTNGGAAIFNYGIAEITGGTFTSVGSYSLSNQSGASMTVAGATVNNGIYSSGATLTINGGNISGNRSGSHVIYAWNSNVTINGGTIHNNNSGNSTVMAAGNSSVDINDGEFTINIVDASSSYLLDAQNTASYDISGGTFAGGIRAQGGTTYNISGGTYTNEYGNYNVYTGGNIDITGGTFASEYAKTFASNNMAEGYELGENGQVVVKPVAKIGDVEYTTLAAAVEAAQAGDEIVLLADVAEDVTVPADVVFNGNGKQAGAITAAGTITFKGITKVTNFGVQYTGTTINIGAGACLEITGTGRLVVGHGCTFNIEGTIADGAAKTADKATLTPSLIVAAGASFTGKDLTFNVKNAYVKFNGNSTSKNSNANGTFNFNVTNSIWEQTGVLAFYVPTGTMDPTFNLNLKDSVLTTTSHLVFSVTKGEIVFDNSNVNVGTSRQLENRSTMIIKNGSVVNGAVATSSNAINPGTIIVENATYAVTGQFSGAAEGTGTLIIKKGATVSVGSIVDKANIQIDATDMTADDEINFTANLSKFAGTVEVINNDKLEAKIVDGKIVLSAKPIAKIGETPYTTLEAAFAAATEGQTITLLQDATPALTSQRAITLAAVIDLGGKTLTLTEDDLYFGTTTFKDGTIVVDPSVKPSTAVFWMFANQTLTFDNVKLVATGVTGTYLIGLDGNNADLNVLNDSEIVVENTTALDLDIICVNASTGNDIVINNSKVKVTNLDGRVFFRGNYTISGTSDIDLSGITKAGFRIEAGQSLTIADTATVDIVGEPRDGGIHLTDYTSTYTKADTATVNATVNKLPVVKIGETDYDTLAEALAAAKSGDIIELLTDVTVEGTAQLPAGITIKSNGKKINGSIRMLGDLTLAGPLTITGGLWVGKGGETLTATLSGDKLTANYFMFQCGTYTINADIDAVYGYLSYNGVFEVNSTIHTTGANGEVLYINGNVTLNDGAVLDSDNSVFVCNDNAVLTLKAGSTVDSNVSITKSGAKVYVDATGMTAGAFANITGTVTNSGNGTVAVVNSDMFVAQIVNGKIVLVGYVAKIGEQKYTSLQSAVDVAVEGDMITLLSDVEQEDGVVITDKKLTVNLNGKTFTVSNGASTNNRNFKINGASEVVISNGTMVAAGNYSSGAYGTVRTEGTANVLLQDLKLYNYRGNGLNIKALTGTTVTMADVEIYSQYGGGIEAAGGMIELTDVVVEQKGMYTSPWNSMAISVNGGGTVTVQSGTYSTECITAEEANNQGTSHGPWVAGVLNSGGTLIINGGIFSNDNFGDNSLATYARGAILADTAANIQINGGTFNALKAIIDITNNLGDASKNPSATLNGGTFSADPRISGLYASELINVADGYLVVENNGVWTVAKAVAKIGAGYYTNLVDAFKAATDGCTIEILADVTVDGKWDCRDYATGGSHSQFKEAVTINGNGYTLKFTGTVSDGNWNTIFRFEENATVDNLTVDISEATGAQRVISAKKSLTVDGLTIVGSAKYGIIYGEGASADDLADTEIVVTNSTLTGTRRAISDNESGKDVKSVVITDNTLEANAYASASESITFNGNTVNGEVDLRSYTAENVLSVEAKDNKLTEGVKNYIYAKNIDAQAEFTAKRPPFKVTTKAELNAAVAAVQDGDVIELLADITTDAVIVIDDDITINGNDKTITSSANRVIRIAADVTINNLNMVSTAKVVYPNDIRGVSIDYYTANDDFDLVLNNCSVDFTHATATDWAYAVNQSGNSSTGNSITIIGGTYEGANVININGTGHTVSIDGATLTSTYAYNSQYYGLCVSFNDGASTAEIKNTTFAGTHAKPIKYNGSTVTEENNTDNTTRCVAQIGDKYYTTLQDALNAAVAGAGKVTVEILSNIDMTGNTWTPVAVDSDSFITVNGNSKTITGLSDMLFASTWAGTSGLVINDLTIADSTIVHDENDSAGNIGVGAFVGYPQASATVTLNNCHLKDSTVKGGHWTGGLVGIAGGYNGTDGPVFMTLTIDGCSVTGSTITGEGSAGGIIGHGSCSAWTDVIIVDSTVSNNTITSTGSSDNKAGSVMGTIGAAGQPTTVNGETKTGGMSVSVTTAGNTVTSADKVITTIYGRQGTETGLLEIAGGTYESYPIEENVEYAAPKDGYIIFENADGKYGVKEGAYVAQINGVKYETIASALAAAQNDAVVELLWAEGNAPIAMNGSVFGKSVTITGTATVDWSKGFLFVGRGGEGNGTVIFDNANLASASDNASTGIHVSGREKNTNNKYDGTVVINNSTIVLDYLIDKGAMTMTNSTLTVKNGFAVGGRPASETESGVDATATFDLTNGSTLIVNNHNGMGLGYEAIGVMTIDSTSTFECTQSFLVTDKGVLKSAGNVFGDIVKSDNAQIELTGGIYTDGEVQGWCAEPYAALPNLNNQYVVGVKPTATVNSSGATTVPAGEYGVWNGSSYTGTSTEDMPLSFVMQFLADQNEEDMKTSPFADWYGDFVITFTGIENGSFTADGCYLAGHYGDFGWVKVPVDGMIIENDARYPVMLGVGLGQKYDYICSSVEDFKCAMFLTPEIIKANPNLKVKLELAVVDNSQGSDSAASALVNNDKVFSVTEYEYGAEAFAPALPTATVTSIDAPEGTPLTFALNFKADDVTDEQLAYYRDWYADFVLTITGLPEEGVTFNTDGTADGYLAGQYDAWSENWVSVPFEDVTLRNGESIKIMEYAATLMGQSGLKLTYNDVYSFVKNFDCGVYFTPEFLAANPDMKVSLSLRMYKTGDATDEGVAIGEMEEFSAPTVVAKIGSTPYATLEAAIAAAGADDTVTILKNVGTDAAIQVAKKVTIDLNGKTIAATENDKVGDGVFCVVAGGDLTINDSVGTGVINGVGDNDYNIAIWANGGKVTINGGNYTNVGATDKTDPNAHFDLIYAKNGGEVIINGGTFECETPAFTLNSHDTYKGVITVNGGTFVGFDPRNNAAETAGTTFMAAGKYTFAEGGNYIVVTPEDYILNGAASDSSTVGDVDSLLAGAVTVTKDGEKYVATATYTFKVTAVDTINPEKSSYELTGGKLRPGKTVAVKYIDLVTGEESWDKPEADTVTFKLVIK